jgi:6,7-dimethyl-8-ribityllumazine synthase
MSLNASILTFDPALLGSIHIAVIASRFNPELVDGLLSSTLTSLRNAGLRDDQVVMSRVPGSAELPYACLQRAKSHSFQAIIALGVLIAGDTQHHDIVARSVTDSLQQLALTHSIPVINGVIAAETYQQAEDRTIGRIARGEEFAHAAMEMALWK